MLVVTEALVTHRRGIEEVEAHFIFGAISKEDGPIFAGVVIGARGQQLVARIKGDRHLVEELGFKGPTG